MFDKIIFCDYNNCYYKINNVRHYHFNNKIELLTSDCSFCYKRSGKFNFFINLFFVFQLLCFHQSNLMIQN